MILFQNANLPEELVGKDKIIFANIAQIQEFHETSFLKEIEKCLDNYEAAGQAFVKYVSRLSIGIVMVDIDWAGGGVAQISYGRMVTVAFGCTMSCTILSAYGSDVFDVSLHFCVYRSGACTLST